MKKFLLTAALVLALVTSLTAGTMAYYNTTVATTTSVHTKYFEYSVVNGGSSYATGVSIAPGDTLKYKYTVTNRSELDVLSTFTTSFTEDGISVPNGEIKGLTVNVTRTSSDEESDAIISEATRKIETIMAEGQEDVYLVTVTWDYTDGTNDGVGDGDGRDLKLVVTANGRQTLDYGTTLGDNGVSTPSQAD